MSSNPNQSDELKESSIDAQNVIKYAERYASSDASVSAFDTASEYEIKYAGQIIIKESSTCDNGQSFESFESGDSGLSEDETSTIWGLRGPRELRVSSGVDIPKPQRQEIKTPIITKNNSKPKQKADKKPTVAVKTMKYAKADVSKKFSPSKKE